MAPRRLITFSDVPHWKDTEAEGVQLEEIMGHELRIDAFETAPGMSGGEEYEQLFVLAHDVDEDKLVKFRCGSKVMLDQLREVPTDEFPVLAALFQEGSGVNKYYTFK